MKKIHYLLCCLFLVAVSCTSAPGSANRREIFDSGKLKVITTFANRKQRTISVLYGNDQALSSALRGDGLLLPQGRMVLVVYRQQDDKFWYGAYQNGRVLSIESIGNLSGNASVRHISYKLEKGSLPGTTTAADRIGFILSHRPAVFP